MILMLKISYRNKVWNKLGSLEIIRARKKKLPIWSPIMKAQFFMPSSNLLQIFMARWVSPQLSALFNLFTIWQMCAIYILLNLFSSIFQSMFWMCTKLSRSMCVLYPCSPIKLLMWETVNKDWKHSTINRVNQECKHPRTLNKLGCRLTAAKSARKLPNLRASGKQDKQFGFFIR